MEPWWKWVKLIFGEIDNAKENEDLTRLPKKEVYKQIESQKETDQYSENTDNDIPF